MFDRSVGNSYIDSNDGLSKDICSLFNKIDNEKDEVEE